ncbi:efflux RND transporter permease subunit [Bovifimicola ammoniilytica]|jgi:predicted RND superfamily exporter protein|uniref:efflux RND transporter permease subunit n=1 Tax=Bovifimicola ammoniilytica TaxID=2981720 RepID=UPI0008216553|nr:MMPL family transporter [Bovifimicola ammoniilytica]MCU6754158.1 MMPL family transporter [Bovifimicola ammoniilytica]SCJ81136.1 Membrane transport protein mmpL8 [uncultured Eubacterium sp.]
MLKLGKKIVKYRIPILILSFLLLIPATISYINTRINYDILSYLPDDIDTMKGQEILTDEFGTGAFSICVVEGMDKKGVAALEEKIKRVDHVNNVIWYDSLADLSVPMDVIPEKIRNAFNNDEKGSTLLIATFDTSTSADETLDGVEKIRKLTKNQCFQSGMSATIADIKKICNTEAVMYVVLAAGLSAIVLALTMDSFLAPVFFLLSIGMAIVYNLGTNFIAGEISFITQALAAVLQLAVTLDYSIFLWHSYQEYREKYPDEKERAMAHAISNTIVSVIGSSITTVAGFVAMCFMTFTLGLDLGIVMAKGVIFGVIGCVTILPAMILTFDKAIQKTKHKALMPNMDKIGNFVTRKYGLFIVLFVVILIPALYGYTHTNVYYDLAGTLPKDLESVVANSKLEDDFSMGATHMILADSNMSSKDTSAMLDAISEVDGVKVAAGLDNLVGPAVPKEVIPDTYKKILDNGKYKLILVASEYKTASDEVNNQITEIQNIVKKYDTKAMVIGEAPCTKDLIDITDKDFKTVSAVSIVLIFIIIAVVLKSISLPVILVAVIEFAIFINMGIPAYTGTTLPFIASIVIGTIQLGATVDYAILMTNKYKKARYNGAGKKEAITSALNGSIQSVFVSALSFFAATFGVGMYSSIDMISSLCVLLARGAIISFLVVVLVLPAMFMIFDKLIINTSMGFKPKKAN